MLVEADGPKISLIQAGRDGGTRPRAIPGAERLDAARPPAFRDDRVEAPEPRRKLGDQGLGNEGHVPGEADHGRGSLDDRGIDPSERPHTGPRVFHHPEIRPPGRRIRAVRNEQRRRTERRRHCSHQSIEDPLPAYHLQPLRPSLEPKGAAARQYGSPDQYLRPRSRSRMTSRPI